MDIDEMRDNVHTLRTSSCGLRSSEEVIERVCNQSSHSERHQNVLRNQERRKVLHGASRRVDLRKVDLRKLMSTWPEPTPKGKRSPAHLSGS